MPRLAVVKAGSLPIALTKIAEELVLNKAQMGLLLSAVFWGLAVSLIPAGVLADRRGFRLPLVFSGACDVLGLFLMARADGLSTAMAGAVVTGIGVGTADALLTPLVCAAYPECRARMTNLLHAFYPIGLVLTILLMIGLTRIGWSWRAVFIALGALSVPFGVTMLALRLPTQSHEGPARLRTRALVSRGVFWMLAAGMFLGAVTVMGPSQWLPTFIEQATGAPREKAGLALIPFGVSMALGRLSASAIVQRLGARRLFAGAGVVCAVSILMAALPVGTGFSMFWLTVVGFGVAAFWPTLLACAGEHYPQAGATMFSLLAAAGMLGGVVGTAAVGFVAELPSLDLHAGMATMAVAPVAAAALLGCLPTRAAIRNLERATGAD